MLETLSNKLFLSSLLKNKILLTVDYFFASNFYKKNDENILLALCYIFAVARNGHLCVKILDEKIYPDPKFLFFENADLLPLFKERLMDGFSNFPIDLIQSKAEHEKQVKPIFFYNESYYLHRNYLIETSIFKHFKDLCKSPPTRNFSKDAFDKELCKLNDHLNENQKEAIVKAVDNSVSFIFGGPGTGKSYTAGILIKLLSRLVNSDFRIILAAPTGKAAQNLESKINISDDLLSISSSTLHSLLSPKVRSIDADLIIIDEASMIDGKMFSLLLESVIPGTRVIFIGDPYQLPPIESGNLFSVFSRLNLKKRSTTLEKAVRNDSDKMRNIAEAIRNEGADKTLSFLKEEDQNISYEDLNDNVYQIKDEILKNIDKYYLSLSFEKQEVELLLKKFSDSKILTPLKVGPFGVDSLNIFIHEYLESLVKSDYFAYPIMVTKNDYELDLYNGTLGLVIRKKNNGKIEEEAYFLESSDGSNSLRKIPLFKLSSYELAYVLSVHKSQGSEFEDILLILPKTSSIFGRELLYTAITRSKKKLKILGSDKLIKDLVKSSCEIQSNLFERLSLMC